MSKRISITVKDDIKISSALWRVMRVAMEGRISGDSFCYHTEFKDNSCVSAAVTKAGNDTFTVYRREKE